MWHASHINYTENSDNKTIYEKQSIIDIETKTKYIIKLFELRFVRAALFKAVHLH